MSPGAAPRIALVGPTSPAAGGITHFTAGLVDALRDRGDLLLLGWTRRYPSRLYPGALDDEVSTTTISARGAQPVLDLLDPRTWREALRRLRAFRADALVLQWVHPIHAPVYRALAAGARRAGIRVVMICHNVEPHESNLAWRLLTRSALGAADVLVVHAAALVDDARALAPGVPVVAAFHPHYGTIAEAAAPASAADVAALRERLGVGDRRLLLSFGYVRPYKGVEDAIRALAEVRSDAFLLVAGECWGDDAPYRAAIVEAGVADRVRLDLRFHANEELPVLFAAADAIVLPYRSASQSGVAALALGFDRPVVATAVGGLPELVEDGVTGALAPPSDPPALAAAIDRVLADGRDWAPACAAARARLSWERYAELLVGAAAGEEDEPDAALTHAVLDVASRRAKAEKILRVVRRARPVEGARLLDVGTGSGTIAAALADAVGPGGAVTSVDVADVRVDREGYAFVRYDGETLPFPDGAFDVVLSNHVIEHVGELAAQRRHVGELARVLAPRGVVYLAAPNRRRLVENHYRLPLLSWLPPRLADRYVRVARRGERYDCRLPTRAELAQHLAAAGLAGEDVTRAVLDATLAVEGGSAARLLRRLPGPARAPLAGPLAPTVVFLGRRPPA